MQRRPGSTLFPYTTLFRSRRGSTSPERSLTRMTTTVTLIFLPSWARAGPASRASKATTRPKVLDADIRSEEHTSELQSRRDLVCRLLLEKEKEPASGKTGG